MNKGDPSTRLAANSSLSRAGAYAAVKTMFPAIPDALAGGESVTIAGFGTFCSSQGIPPRHQGEENKNNAELGAGSATELSLTKTEADRMVGAVFAAIAERLSKEETVSIAGFGTIGTPARPARQGRNPVSARRSRAPPPGRRRSRPATPFATLSIHPGHTGREHAVMSGLGSWGTVRERLAGLSACQHVCDTDTRRCAVAEPVLLTLPRPDDRNNRRKRPASTGGFEL